MAIKALVLVKRRPDLTLEEFRDGYDRHVRLALKYFGHLWLAYRRNYLGPSVPFAESWPPQPGNEGGTYDAIAEIIYRDEDALQESQRIALDPEVKRLFLEDEEKTFDRSVSRIAICEVIETELR